MPLLLLVLVTCPCHAYALHHYRCATTLPTLYPPDHYPFGLPRRFGSTFTFCPHRLRFARGVFAIPHIIIPSVLAVEPLAFPATFTLVLVCYRWWTCNVHAFAFGCGIPHAFKTYLPRRRTARCARLLPPLPRYTPHPHYRYYHCRARYARCRRTTRARSAPRLRPAWRLTPPTYHTTPCRALTAAYYALLCPHHALAPRSCRLPHIVPAFRRPPVGRLPTTPIHPHPRRAKPGRTAGRAGYYRQAPDAPGLPFADWTPCDAATPVCLLHGISKPAHH